MTVRVLRLGGFLLAAALATVAVPACPHRVAAPQRDSLQVTFVPDGDTVRGYWRSRLEWVRLLRIDTPERDEPGYAKAREALEEMLDGRRIEIEFESPGVPERDVHGRLLAYVFADGTNCDIEIVRAGWSRFWTRYGAGRYAEDFREAELEAREAGRGIWARDPRGGS